MKAAIINSRGRVVGYVTDLDSEQWTLDICGGFSKIKSVETVGSLSYGDARNFEIGENETPVNIKTYRLSYIERNIAQAEKWTDRVVKIKCLDYPEGFYCW